jgi:membrane protein
VETAGMKKKFSFKLLWIALKESFKGFSDHKVTKLSASLAYYTVFSLGPMLIVIIFLAGLILGQEAAQGEIYKQVQSFIGDDAALQIQTIIKNAAISNKGGMAATIGVIALLVGATTVFGEIQDSINSIWGIKARPKAGIMKLILTRLLSFGLIASLGFLLLVSLAVTAIVEGIGKRLEAAFPDVTVIVIYVVNLVLTIGITTVLFGAIFKVLPDIKIKWKDIWPGAIATSLLFLIGKFAISFYISKSDVGSTYGAAGSLVILLLWIYYSSIILYFGAEFTRAYALHKGVPIVPTEYAEWENKPAIAGATPPSQQNRSGQRESGKGKGTMPSPGFAMTRAAAEKEKEKSAGLGTLAMGLLLYYFNKRGE